MPFEDKPQKEFELCPDGLHRMRLVWLVDLGTHEDNYKGEITDKKKILLGFELIDTAMKDGRPFLVSQEYNISPSKYGGYYAAKTSNLFALAKSWLKVDESKAGKIGTFGTALGSLGQVLLSHHEYTNAEGKQRTKVKIDAIQPLAKAKEKDAPEAKNAIVNYQIGDEFPHDLPEWIKNRIAKSKEMTVNSSSEPVVSSDSQATPTIDESEIPF